MHLVPPQIFLKIEQINKQTIITYQQNIDVQIMLYKGYLSYNVGAFVLYSQL